LRSSRALLVELGGLLGDDRRRALENQRRDLSRTFVLVDEISHEVVGYYSPTMGHVVRSGLPKVYGRGLPDLPIGMVLLARLAISRATQGEGCGRDLSVDAILQAVLYRVSRSPTVTDGSP
jgi:hypothetical protein